MARLAACPPARGFARTVPRPARNRCTEGSSSPSHPGDATTTGLAARVRTAPLDPSGSWPPWTFPRGRDLPRCGAVNVRAADANLAAAPSPRRREAHPPFVPRSVDSLGWWRAAGDLQRHIRPAGKRGRPCEPAKEPPCPGTSSLPCEPIRGKRTGSRSANGLSAWEHAGRAIERTLGTEGGGAPRLGPPGWDRRG
jgi:hypothetical protein